MQLGVLFPVFRSVGRFRVAGDAAHHAEQLPRKKMQLVCGPLVEPLIGADAVGHLQRLLDAFVLARDGHVVRTDDRHRFPGCCQAFAAAEVLHGLASFRIQLRNRDVREGHVDSVLIEDLNNLTVHIAGYSHNVRFGALAADQKLHAAVRQSADAVEIGTLQFLPQRLASNRRFARRFPKWQIIIRQTAIPMLYMPR